MDKQTVLREHILELLEGKFAHIGLETAIKRFPVSKINASVENSPHTAWELLEHIRIAQWDILEFSRDASHVSPDFPDGYWPKAEGTAETWQKSAAQILKDLHAMRDLVADKNTNLFAKIAHGDGQTILREALVLADHNAYHLGQIMLLKKMFSK